MKTKLELSDMTLVILGKEIAVHRLVLSAQSPYFDALFRADFIEQKQKVIDLSKSISSYEALQAIVEFFYTGEIEIGANTVESLLECSSILLVENVQQCCIDFLVSRVGLDSCLKILTLADKFSLQDVSSLCEGIIVSRFRDSLQYDDATLRVHGDNLLKLINLGAMDFFQPSDTAMFLSRWVEKNPNDLCCETIIKNLVEKNLLTEPFQSDNFLETCGDSIRALDQNFELEPRVSFEKPSYKCAFLATFDRDPVQEGDGNIDDILFLAYVPELDVWCYLFGPVNEQLPMDVDPSGAHSVAGVSSDAIVLYCDMAQYMVYHYEGQESHFETVDTYAGGGHMLFICIFNDKVLYIDARLTTNVRLSIHQSHPESLDLCQASIGGFPESDDDRVHLAVGEGSDHLDIFMYTQTTIRSARLTVTNDNNYELTPNGESFQLREPLEWTTARIQRNGIFYLGNDCSLRFDSNSGLWEYVSSQIALDVLPRNAPKLRGFPESILSRDPYYLKDRDHSNKPRHFFTAVDMIKETDEAKDIGVISYVGHGPFITDMWKGVGKITDPESFEWNQCRPPPYWPQFLEEGCDKGFSEVTVPSVFLKQMKVWSKFPLPREHSRRRPFCSRKLIGQRYTTDPRLDYHIENIHYADNDNEEEL